MIRRRATPQPKALWVGIANSKVGVTKQKLHNAVAKWQKKFLANNVNMTFTVTTPKPAFYDPFDPPPFIQRNHKQRQRVKRMSDFYRDQMRIYGIRRKIFLAKPENEFCRVFEKKKANQIHHIFGRGRGGVGPLLLDERFWLPVCQMGQDTIHQNPEWAIGQGFLAPKGQFNVPQP